MHLAPTQLRTKSCSCDQNVFYLPVTGLPVSGLPMNPFTPINSLWIGDTSFIFAHCHCELLVREIAFFGDVVITPSWFSCGLKPTGQWGGALWDFVRITRVLVVVVWVPRHMFPSNSKRKFSILQTVFAFEKFECHVLRQLGIFWLKCKEWCHVLFGGIFLTKRYPKIPAFLAEKIGGIGG